MMTRCRVFVQPLFTGLSDHHFCNGFTRYDHPRIAKVDVCREHNLRAITEDSVSELVKAAEAGIWAIWIRRQWHTEIPDNLPDRVIIPEAAKNPVPSEMEVVEGCWREVPDIIRSLIRMSY